MVSYLNEARENDVRNKEELSRWEYSKEKRKKGLYLTCNRKYHSAAIKKTKSKLKTNVQHANTEAEYQTSTPKKGERFKTERGKRKQHELNTSTSRSPFKSPSHKKGKFLCLSPIVKSLAKGTSPSKLKICRKTFKSPSSQNVELGQDHNYCETATLNLTGDTESNLMESDDDTSEETFLYPLESSLEEGIVNSDTSVVSQSTANYEENKDAHELLNDVLQELSNHSVKEEFVLFLKLVAERKFPLNNVAFMLFLDVIKWFSNDDIRSIRYNDTCLKFFWIGKKLFGGRFLRFMSGPKNETNVLVGLNSLSPMESKINFACPSESVLNNYNPLGYEIVLESGPGVINKMIELSSEKKEKDASYVIMFDGKKIKRGSDMDLLGLEEQPLKQKKERLETHKQVVDNALNLLQKINKHIENDQDIEARMKTDLYKLLLECFTVMSSYLQEMRKLKKAKTLAMAKYKEKVQKDPRLGKTLEYAMDACRTSSFQIDNCVSVLLDAQWEICKTASFLNGVLHLFAKSKSVNIEEQQNVHLLKSVEEMKIVFQTDDIPTRYVKQRSDEWHDARKEFKVTGSTVYTSIGCDGLKRQNEHFDSAFSNSRKQGPTESQAKAMKHGVDCEGHEIATLASVVMPFMFPNLTFYEEGYYVEDNVLVSPDGSLKDTNGVMYAFEGKAPVGNEYTTRQHYKVPERYITQTIFEQKVMKAKNGTIYLCWTPESTTVFIVPVNEAICDTSQRIINDIYLCEVPKKPSRLSKDTKELKEQIKAHVLQCQYLGEFPSVKSDSTYKGSDQALIHSYCDLTRLLLRAKSCINDAYNLQRTYASQVLVYLLADLDRMWKTELPHAVPVMYCYRGYSLSMGIARQLLDKCRKACTEKGLDVVAVSSDGEFLQLMVKGKNGEPLTVHQLSKSVWSDVCKYKKHEIVKLLKNINRKHIEITDHTGKMSAISVDGGSLITTPKTGWRLNSRVKTSQQKENEQNAVHESDNVDAHLEEISCYNQNNMEDQDVPMKPDCNANVEAVSRETKADADDTLQCEFQEILRVNDDPPKEKAQSFPKPVNEKEAKDILHLLCQRKPEKWSNTSSERLKELLNKSPDKLLKDELLDVAKYMNLKLIGTALELKVKNVLKADLVKELSQCFGSEVPVTKKRKKIFQPKKLQDIAVGVLMKSSYPKQVLNTAYASYIWPEKLKQWRENGRVSERVFVRGKMEETSFIPYYTPEYDETEQDFRVFTYDKTHLGTNLRKCICLNKVAGVSIHAWKRVAEVKPNILHPEIIEVSEEGKILDQMKEKLARCMLSMAVQKEMIRQGFTKEAEFCRVIREGLYVADDTPGIPAFERCLKRLDLIRWLDDGVDFATFPPYGATIKGMSHILYEGLRTSQEAKLYLYVLAKKGTYCVRAPNTLCSESFFGSMQDMDPWGQGILSASGVQKHIADFTTINAMKMQESRNIYIKTKKDTAYPAPQLLRGESSEDSDTEAPAECFCRKEKFIRCIVPRDHYFDTPERARVYKDEKTYQPIAMTETLRGEQPIRTQYGYKINEARMLPSKRLGIDSLINKMDA